MAVDRTYYMLLLLLLFLTFGVLVADSNKLLFYTVSNPARGLLNREMYILYGGRRGKREEEE